MLQTPDVPEVIKKDIAEIKTPAIRILLSALFILLMIFGYGWYNSENNIKSDCRESNKKLEDEIARLNNKIAVNELDKYLKAVDEVNRLNARLDSLKRIDTSFHTIIQRNK